MKPTRPRGFRAGCSCEGCDNSEVFSTPEKGKGWRCEDCREGRCKHRKHGWWAP